MERETKKCGGRSADGSVCDEIAAVRQKEVYRQNERGDTYLAAIHFVIRCPHCGMRIEVEQLCNGANYF